MDIVFEPIFKEAAPELEVILVTADVVNSPTDDGLWAELNALSERIGRDYQMEMVNKRAGIAGTRAAYKALGKEPNRYRPSSESMCRRMVKGLGLYRSLAVIDLINLLSVASGHSIGGFDADMIVGDTLTLGVGREGEPYEAIGRGRLNIACLPVFRDAVGGVGTPTSDNDRTKLSEGTTRLVMTINIYRPEMERNQIIALTERLLTQYAKAKNITFRSYRP
jgi:DNA/RNA-binding domain of Phe-tRNA-synthetase-like protein